MPAGNCTPFWPMRVWSLGVEKAGRAAFKLKTVMWPVWPSSFQRRCLGRGHRMPTKRAGLYFQSCLLLFLRHVRLEKPLAPLGSCTCAFVYTFTPFQNVLFMAHSVYMASLCERGGELCSHLYPCGIVRRSLCLSRARPHFTKGSQVQPARGLPKAHSCFLV